MLILALLAACATVPYTNRSQLMLVPESQDLALGAQAYAEVLKKAKVAHDPEAVDAVREVGERIAKAANKPDYQWEFTVIDDDKTANAFALPGGKVAVYTGMFPVAHDSAGLAAVLGHEVGHAVARHGAERMSQMIPLQVAEVGLAVVLGAASPATQQAVMGAFGLGAQVGIMLPFSRSQEAEADHLGLILMAEAGYDPHAALELWQRFEQTAAAEKAPPEFLSTHPAYGTRQRNIEAWLPEAQRYFHPDPDVKVVTLPGV
jgi:predicted Zn-dependent protease